MKWNGINCEERERERVYKREGGWERELYDSSIWLVVVLLCVFIAVLLIKGAEN